MGKVIRFPGFELTDEGENKSDEIIIQMMGQVIETEPKELLIISFDTNGEMDVVSNMTQESRIIWALEKLKLMVMNENGPH